jgi:hypothetical protein
VAAREQPLPIKFTQADLGIAPIRQLKKKIYSDSAD